MLFPGMASVNSAGNKAANSGVSHQSPSPFRSTPPPAMQSQSYASKAASGFTSSSAPNKRKGKNSSRPNQRAPADAGSSYSQPLPNQRSQSSAPSVKVINKSRMDSFDDNSDEFRHLLDVIPTLRQDIDKAKETFTSNMANKSRVNPCLRPPIVVDVNEDSSSTSLSVLATIGFLSSESFPASAFDALKCYWRGYSFAIYLHDESAYDSLYTFLSNNKLHLLNALCARNVRVSRYSGWSVTIRIGGFPHHVPDHYITDMLFNEWGICEDDLVKPPFRPITKFSDSGADESSVADIALIELRSIPAKLQMLTMAKISSFEAFGSTIHWSWELPPTNFQVKCLLCSNPHHWKVCGLPKMYPDIFNKEMMLHLTSFVIKEDSPIQVERKPNPSAWVSSIIDPPATPSQPSRNRTPTSVSQPSTLPPSQSPLPESPRGSKRPRSEPSFTPNTPSPPISPTPLQSLPLPNTSLPNPPSLSSPFYPLNNLLSLPTLGEVAHFRDPKEKKKQRNLDSSPVSSSSSVKPFSTPPSQRNLTQSGFLIDSSNSSSQPNLSPPNDNISMEVDTSLSFSSSPVSKLC